MTFEFKHPNYYKKLKIDRDTVGYDFKVVAYKKVQSCMED